MCLCFYLSLHLSLSREMCGNIVVWSSVDTMLVGFRICVYVCVCVVRCWAILLCGRVVTQGGRVVVVWVAITEQVLNYPPDVRCGGAAMFV